MRKRDLGIKEDGGMATGGKIPRQRINQLTDISGTKSEAASEKQIVTPKPKAFYRKRTSERPQRRPKVSPLI